MKDHSMFHFEILIVNVLLFAVSIQLHACIGIPW